MKWFTLSEEKIEGPYSTDALLRKIEVGDLSIDALIWGSLQDGWKSVGWWKQALPHLKSVQSENEVSEQWHYVQNGQRVGPVSRNQLVDQLKNLASQENCAVNKILVWTKGFKNWTQLVELHDLMNEVGIDQRKHPRAKASGRVVISFQGQSHITSLKSISEGGFGTEPVPMVYPGEEVQVQIEASELGGSISAKAQVRYANDRILGLQFIALNSENKSSIVTYIRNRSNLSHKSAA